MDIILKKDVKGLGEKDTLVNVKDGYARNYLIPKGFAVEASSGNITVMKAKEKSKKLKNEREIEKARSIADKIEEIELIFKMKSGKKGKLFGSITGQDIAEKLKSTHNIDVDKKKISLPDSIKSLGTYEVEIKLQKGVSPKLKVTVLDEQEE